MSKNKKGPKEKVNQNNDQQKRTKTERTQDEIKQQEIKSEEERRNKEEKRRDKEEETIKPGVKKPFNGINDTIEEHEEFYL